ncbi:DUF397 domain-containing protein [Lentzea alba]|uniref:DUF397 domain-containing protein n=1 Tax=Lentzea alba TaxID=2714351 RepID=UPI0039BF2BFB
MTAWRKSSYSGGGNNCVEVGRSVGIRDSKAPATHIPRVGGRLVSVPEVRPLNPADDGSRGGRPAERA